MDNADWSIRRLRVLEGFLCEVNEKRDIVGNISAVNYSINFAVANLLEKSVSRRVDFVVDDNGLSIRNECDCK